MGINWWESDPSLSNNAKQLESENRELRDRVDRLERLLDGGEENANTRAGDRDEGR